MISKSRLEINTTTPWKNSQEILIDRSATGRVRPWRAKAISRDFISKIYEKIDLKKSARIRECANRLYFTDDNGVRKLIKTYFCRCRLCPMCIWRRSLKIYNQVRRIMGSLERENKYKFIFLTLTVRNCAPEDLKKTLDNIQHGWKLLMLLKPLKHIIKGYFRTVEISHNISDDSYHPHLHCVLVVDKNYFTDKNHYVSQAKWREYWAECMKLDYDPWINIKKCYGDLSDSVCEIAKYSVSEGSYIISDDKEFTHKTVKLLDSVLDKRRFVSLGGAMKIAHRRLNLDDMETGDLINIEKTDYKIPNFDSSVFFWHTGYRQYIKA